MTTPTTTPAPLSASRTRLETIRAAGYSAGGDVGYLLAEIDRLRAERHSTNAALADLTVAHRAERDSATAEVTSSHAQWERWARKAEELAAELDSVRAESEKRRKRMVAAEGDLMDIRGSLSPSGRPRKVPMELGNRVAPAVDWLLAEVERLSARVAELEAVRIREGRIAEQCHQYRDLDPDSACRPAGFTCPNAAPEVAR